MNLELAKFISSKIHNVTYIENLKTLLTEDQSVNGIIVSDERRVTEIVADLLIDHAYELKEKNLYRSLREFIHDYSYEKFESVVVAYMSPDETINNK